MSSNPGSSASSSTHSQTASSPDERHLSKKRKMDASPSDPVHWIYENLQNLIKEEFLSYDWSGIVLSTLQKESPRSAPNLFNIIKSTLSNLHKSSSNNSREFALLKNKLHSLETMLSKQNASSEVSSKASASKSVNKVSQREIPNETLLITIENLSFVKPFGKFNIELYSSLIVLSSKKGECFNVLLEDIENVIRVESPTSKDEVVVLPLRSAITVGKTMHDAIALKFKAKDSISVSIPKTSNKIELRGKTVNDLKDICSSSSNASRNITSLFGLVTAKPIDMENEGVFRSLSASRTCIICHHKASHGILWPLKSGLLFGLKPLVWLPASRITKVDFIRSSRYFELVVSIRSTAQTFNFEMIEIEEESALARYCSLQKFGQRGGKEEALYNKEVAPSMSKKADADFGIDLEESSDDSDFVMESSSASSIPEDYDSEVEDTDAEVEDGSESQTEDSQVETDHDSNGDAHAAVDASDNGLDAFAVVSGSDSDA